jgi:hypothetical protein
MFSLLCYYGTVTTCTVNCCSNVDIIASHMQHHQGNPICHIINGFLLNLVFRVYTNSCSASVILVRYIPHFFQFFSSQPCTILTNENFLKLPE